MHVDLMSGELRCRYVTKNGTYNYIALVKPKTHNYAIPDGTKNTISIDTWICYEVTDVDARFVEYFAETILSYTFQLSAGK